MKRSSRKKRIAKLSKLGLSLAAITVLGGLVEPMGLTDFGLTKVYAETYINTSDQLIGVVIWHIAENTDGSSFRLNGDGGYMEVQPGQEIISSAPNYDGYTLSHTTYAPPAWDGGDGILRFVYKQNKIAEQPVEPAGDTNSTDTNTVNYTIQLVDQDGQVLQTIQQSGVEGTEVSFDFPVISGYRVGKSEGFDSWTYGKGGTFRLVANKTVKVYYDKAPSIDSLIRPEQRVEYQKVFDTFHTTVLKAFEVYKKELGVDHIIRLTEDEAKFNQITQSEDLTTLQLELILVENLFNEPVGLVLTDQDIINAIGWTPEYWDYQIAYHKEITQKLEKAMANIAASKAIPTVPVDQSITIKAVYTEEQIEPGQKVDVLKEIEYTLKPGESVVLEPLAFEGWTSRVVQESQTVTYEEAKARPNKEYYFYYIEEGTTPTEKPIETPAETPTEKPAEQLVEKPTEQPVEKLVERPTASPTEQSAPGKQATKQGDKEPAAPASQSKQSTVKPASTSQSQAKSLPATGEASSVLHLTGLGLLGLAGLVVKRRSGKSS
ncbi:LPXTG cell wall anchor domain-containing protein [Streptococcus suis]|uniref:LPXTG cell wall anchor domain-containing protein n=1 Tax=Streptococcus suis TaxID=1307 RepID=UPI000CF37E90|nr:LPXTG cell wall anchor domain-containing protein [Streptococcus suis]MDG4507390.1 LPXTG cell wall anchor domain-containing protein [Streptococcus suis]